MIELTCEACDAKESIVSRDDLPDGWLELTVRDGEDNETEAVVCSFECAYEWLEGIEGGSDEDEDEDDESDEDAAG